MKLTFIIHKDDRNMKKMGSEDSMQYVTKIY